MVLKNGEFGESSGPMFLDDVGCSNEEEMLLRCELSNVIGLIDECACAGCVEALAVSCPGKLFLDYLVYIHTLYHTDLVQMKMNVLHKATTVILMQVALIFLAPLNVPAYLDTLEMVSIVQVCEQQYYRV